MKTPQQTYDELNRNLGTEVYLKREDQHKYKSHKGRSIPPMIKTYAKEGATHFVISSSGNAAIAAGLAVENHNRNNPQNQISLTVFVGQHVDKKKLDVLRNELKDTRITIEQVERPKQQAFQLDKEDKAKNLRQSTDDLALEGYLSLADDLSKIPNLQAVFVPTSSGTTAQALHTGFTQLGLAVQIHIVQTTTCHPIADEFDTVETPKENSVAGAIVDNVAHRKAKVVEAIKESKGSGWIVTNDEINAAKKLVRESANIEVSPNSALAVAGLKKAIAKGWKWNGPVVCIVTGM